MLNNIILKINNLKENVKNKITKIKYFIIYNKKLNSNMKYQK